MAISIDAFDQTAAEKKFDEIEKNANKDVSFDKADVAKKMGVKKDELNIPDDRYKPGIKIIKDITDNDLREKVTNAMMELRAEQLTNGEGSYSSLTADQKTQIDIELGNIDKDDFVNNEKSDWMYNATHTKTRGGDAKTNNTQIMNMEVKGNKRNKNLSLKGSKKPAAEERDQSSCPIKTSKNTGIVVNEKTKEDPDSMTIGFNGKQSAVRMGKEGVHISSDQALNMVIGACESVAVNGQSAKSVDGSYNLTINGPIKIHSTGNIFISTDANMNFTSKGNINFQCNGNFNICAKGKVGIISKGEMALNADGKLSLLTEDALHVKSNGGCAFGGQGDVSLKGSGNVNIDGATVNINGGASEDASPTKIADFAVPAAAPTKPVVPKI